MLGKPYQVDQEAVEIESSIDFKIMDSRSTLTSITSKAT